MIGEFIERAGNILTDTLGKLNLNNASNFIGGLFEKISSTVITIERMIPEVIELFKDVMKSFGIDNDILDEDEDLSDFASRYMKATDEGIKRENHKTIEDFREAIKNEGIEADKVENPETNRALEYIGAGIVKNELDIKADTNVPEVLYAKLGQMDLDISKFDINKIGKIVKDYDLTNEKIDSFDRDSLSLSEKNDVKNAIVDIIKLAEPDKDRIEILEDYYKNTDENGSIFS